VTDRIRPFMHFEPHFFLHRTFKPHYKALCNKSEIIAGRSACTDSHSTKSAIATCGMPKFRKPRRNLIDLKNRRKVDFKVDYSSLWDPSIALHVICTPPPPLLPLRPQAQRLTKASSIQEGARMCFAQPGVLAGEGVAGWRWTTPSRGGACGLVSPRRHLTSKGHQDAEGISAHLSQRDKIWRCTQGASKLRVMFKNSWHMEGLLAVRGRIILFIPLFSKPVVIKQIPMKQSLLEPPASRHGLNHLPGSSESSDQNEGLCVCSETQNLPGFEKASTHFQNSVQLCIILTKPLHCCDFILFVSIVHLNVTVFLGTYWRNSRVLNQYKHSQHVLLGDCCVFQ
jgi:hypothetical protein